VCVGEWTYVGTVYVGEWTYGGIVCVLLKGHMDVLCV